MRRGRPAIEQPIARLLTFLREGVDAGVCLLSEKMRRTGLTVREALPMMTIEGAYLLHREDEVGSLDPGKQADLAAIRLDCIETQPVYDVISQIVYAVPDNQVTDVWVAGRHLLDDRSMATLDEADILAECRDWRERISGAIDREPS